MKAPSKKYVLGIPISTENFDAQFVLASARDRALTVTFVNPHACHVAKEEPDYLSYLEKIDWVLCDGIGMVYAARFVGKLVVARAAFDLTSLAEPVFSALSGMDAELLFVGGHTGVAEAASIVIGKRFPDLNIVGSFTGYGADLDLAIEFLSTNVQTVVVCGMGAPRQEKFLLDAKQAGWSGVGFTCGGFLDQVVDKEDYYPAVVDKMQLRFVYRLFKEPRRLWKRYLIEYQVFLRKFLGALILR